jgi:hypothetical protein
MEIPNVNPEKLEAYHEAAQICMKGLLDNFEEETAAPEDCAKIARGVTEVERDLLAIRRTAERQLRKLLREAEKEGV